jgi:hypothetical protein
MNSQIIQNFRDISKDFARLEDLVRQNLTSQQAVEALAKKGDIAAILDKVKEYENFDESL